MDARKFLEKKVYIFCPAKHATGGTELLHQLHQLLINKNVKSYIYYIDTGIFIDKSEIIADRFKKYVKDPDKEIVTELLDSPDNILIVPEYFIPHAFEYAKVKKIIWWLSVDNFFKSVGIDRDIVINANYFKKILKFVTYRPPFNYLKQANIVLHLYQCEYINDFLSKVYVNNKRPLSDFINSDYLCFNKNAESRKDVILYNPKKGGNIINELKSSPPGNKYKWIALENMTVDEMKDTFARAKLYIDFGKHPGKDRIPREAVLSGCCIITNKEGSAFNDKDVAIKSEYKFEKPLIDKIQLFNLIDGIFKNFDFHFKHFIPYREKILDEEKVFNQEVADFVSFLNNL